MTSASPATGGEEPRLHSLGNLKILKLAPPRLGLQVVVLRVSKGLAETNARKEKAVKVVITENIVI